MGKQTIITQIDGVYMLRRRQHGNHKFTRRHLRRQISHGVCALGLKRGNRLWVQVMGIEFVTGLYKIARHRQAHMAKTDKGDPRHLRNSDLAARGQKI